MTTPGPEPRKPSARRRRGLLAVLLAAVACSVCLLPALITTAVACITGWLTGTIGLAIAATVLTIGAGLLWVRRHGAPRATCRCSSCA